MASIAQYSQNLPGSFELGRYVPIKIYMYIYIYIYMYDVLDYYSTAKFDQ